MTAVVFPAATKSTLSLLLTVTFDVPSINVPVKNDACTKFPPSILPAVKLPVTSACPPVLTLPAETLPVNVPTPVAMTLPRSKLPPVITMPVSVTFAVSAPSTFNSILPSAAGIRTLDVPF